MTIIFIILAWVGGSSAMWLYLRFSKLIRNRAEHQKAINEEVYRLKDSKGLAGAIYTADATEFRKFVGSYLQYQRDIFRDLMRRKERGWSKCEK